MMTRTESEEYEALRWAGVPEIPEAEDENTPVWIYAIAKVTTNTNRLSYAIVRQDYGRRPNMVKTFTEEGIARIDSIHPYKFLDKSYLPQLESAAATKVYVANAYGVPEDEIKKLKKPDVLRLLYMHCIKTQLAAENEQHK